MHRSLPKKRAPPMPGLPREGHAAALEAAPFQGLSAAAPGLPAQAWTATKSGRLWRAHRGAKRLGGTIKT
jgi:hypothetical protein